MPFANGSQLGPDERIRARPFDDLIHDARGGEGGGGETAPFSPEGHKGHKMVVRGLLIKSGSETRINLTSFQMVAETCAK
jgi:hypothetical protein